MKTFKLTHDIEYEVIKLPGRPIIFLINVQKYKDVGELTIGDMFETSDNKWEIVGLEISNLLTYPTKKSPNVGFQVIQGK